MSLSNLSVTKTRHFTGHIASVYCIAGAADERSFYTGAGDGVIAEWHLDGGDTATGIARVPGNIFSLLYIKKHQLLIAGDMNGGVYVIDLETKTAIKNLFRENAAVYALYYFDDTDELWVGDASGTVKVWDICTFALLDTKSISTKSIRHINVSADGSAIVFSCSDNNLYVTDRNINITHTLAGHLSSVFCSAFNAAGNLLVSGSRDARLRTWDVTHGYANKAEIQAHLYTINDIKLSPDGKLFATAGRDKHIKLWNAETMELLKVIDKEKFEGHINSVNKLFWSDWNNSLISCGDDRAVMVWGVEGEELKGE